jgi:GT2 family glycosyltransferase
MLSTALVHNIEDSDQRQYLARTLLPGNETKDLPLVTVIWLNYNSSNIEQIVLESLGSVLALDYPRLEIILIDNGSTDGSFEIIDSFVREKVTSAAIKKVKLPENCGFAQGNNVGFRARNPATKYVALINNDVIVEPNSLKRLVKILEENKQVAGVQGTLLNWQGDKVDNAGFMRTPQYDYYPRISASMRPAEVTYLSGAYSVYRISCIGSGDLFLPYFFIYGDDNELGIRLWRMGYRLLHVPIIAGRHHRSATVNISSAYRTLSSYWARRTHSAIMVMYDNMWLLHILLSFSLLVVSSFSQSGRLFLRGFIDGVRDGLFLRKKAMRLGFLKSREPRIKVGVLKWMQIKFLMFWYSSGCFWIDNSDSKCVIASR